MKLIALYSIYNGLELLEGSIAQIEPLTDHILLCWQKTSNRGRVSQEIEPFLKRFAGNKKISLLYFEPDLRLNTKENEKNKHNLMLEYAKRHQFTHFFFSATDHYYDTKEFLMAKTECRVKGYDVTTTKMYTYYKYANWRLFPIENYEMPFICRLHEKTKIEHGVKFPVRVDPALHINTCDNFYSFSEEQIMMHHYSMIRIDLQEKFLNAAASIRWKKEDINRFLVEYKNAKLGDEIYYFQKRKLVESQNIFNINI